MKYRVEVDGKEYQLDLVENGDGLRYVLEDLPSQEGAAAVEEISPGNYLVMMGTAHRAVRITKPGQGTNGAWEVWVDGRKHLIEVSDPRDRLTGQKRASAHGPQEIRAQMPGKVVKLLVTEGESVTVGQGLLVIEAMKMQNEMKSPKDGTVLAVKVSEGSTVAAGEAMIVVE